MKITRRLLLALFLLAPLTLSSLGEPAPARTYTVLVGTYTGKTGSKGIYAFEFDAETGKLAPKGLAAETPNPSWLVLHPNGKWVYAANESGKQSTISAFSLDSNNAQLTLLNQLPAQGEDPCHLSFDKSGKFLFVANYTSGTVAVFPILDDGKLGAPTSVVKDAGVPGPDKERQEGPHAHWILPSPDNRYVLVSDLGLDELLVYRFNATNGTLTPNDPAFAKLAPGAGPRHAAFSSDGKSIFVLSELNSTVTTFSYDPARGSLAELQVVSTLPLGFSGHKQAAEISLQPSGRGLYASNRGHDSIAVFRIADPDRKLATVEIIPTGGKEPRHFALDPTGQFLLVENQYSNSIVVFRIDPATGALTQVSKTDNIPSPVCLIFLPAL